MSRKQYAGIVILEGALLSILSICVSVSLAEGFYIPEAWSGRILPALIFCSATTVYWNLMTFNKKSSIAAILIFIISVFLTIMVLLRADEDLEKKLLFLIITSLVSTSAFFLSRTRIGAAALIAVGSMIICGNAFLQYGNHPKLLCLYVPAAVLLTTERNYRIRIRSSSTREPSVSRHTAAGFICCVLSISITGLLMALIIPAQLPTHELKLIKELVRMPVLEKIGTASTIPLDDKNQFTEEMNEEKNPTSKKGKNQTEVDTPEENQDSDYSTEKKDQESPGGGEEKGLRAIRYEQLRNLRILLPLLIAAGVASAIFLKKRQRKNRIERFDRMDPQESAAAYYQYFLHILSLIHLNTSETETVREYNRKTKRRTDVLFTENNEFARISQDFEKIYYGGEDFTEDIRERFRNACRILPAQCCHTVGKIRYMLLFFRT